MLWNAFTRVYAHFQYFPSTQCLNSLFMITPPLYPRSRKSFVNNRANDEVDCCISLKILSSGSWRQTENQRCEFVRTVQGSNDDRLAPRLNLTRHLDLVQAELSCNSSVFIVVSALKSKELSLQRFEHWVSLTLLLFRLKDIFLFVHIQILGRKTALI